MPCPSATFGGTIRRNVSWNNWQDSAETSVKRFLVPSSLPDIVRAVQDAEDAGRRLHAVGGGFSLNDCAAGQDWMIDLRSLNRTLDGVTGDVGRRALTNVWRRRLTPGSDKRLVHIEAGARLYDICQRWKGLGRVEQIAAANGKLFVRTADDELFQRPVRGGDWHYFGHANGFAAMAADEFQMYGVPRSDLFQERRHSGANVNWTLNGSAPSGTIAMTASGGDVYCATRAGTLHRRAIGETIWSQIGMANRTTGLAAVDGLLFAATSSNQLRVRNANGQTETWRDIDTAFDVVSMTGLDGELHAVTSDGRLWTRPALDGTAVWTPGEVIRRPSADLAFPTLGGFLGQTLAGAVKTSTHGSDMRQGPLPEFVHALHVVSTGGRELWIERASRTLTEDNMLLRQALSLCRDIRIIRNDDVFNAAVVDMGRFGICYAMVLEAKAEFHLAEFTEPLDWSEVSQAFRRRRDRIRQIDWEQIGSAENISALAGNNTRLFATTTDNRLLTRAATEADPAWRDIGQARGIVALAASQTALFAVTNSGSLIRRPISMRDTNWGVTGDADGITALAVWGRRLFATTRDNRLVRRSTRDRSEIWLQVGPAEDVVSLTARLGDLLAIRSNGRVAMRPITGTDSPWVDAGPASGIRHIATAGPFLWGVSSAGDLRTGQPQFDHFDEITQMLSTPPERLGLQGREFDFRYFDLVMSTRGPDTCYVRRRWEVASDSNPQEINMANDFQLIWDIGLTPHLREGLFTIADTLVLITNGVDITARGFIGSLPIPPELMALAQGLFSLFSTTETTNIIAASAKLKALAAQDGVVLGDALAVALNLLDTSVVANHIPQLFEAVNDFANTLVRDELFPGNAETLGRQGMSWAVSSGTTDPVHFGEIYKGDSFEVVFPMRDARFVDFIQSVLDRMMDELQAGYIAVRFTARSDAFLSMYNVSDHLGCAIEITSLTGLRDNRGWMEWLHDRAISLGGRPHWGQFNRMTERQTATLYGSSMDKWRRAFSRNVGPTRTFSNDYTRSRGLEFEE